jgi:glycosyltransferase involved in cell wall biosynthesis
MTLDPTQLNTIANDPWLSTPTVFSKSTWGGHAPFARWLTRSLRPKTFVELGTHFGYSYFTFCHAIQDLGIDAKAFAVDHWAGDPQAGEYQEQVFSNVDAYNDTYFKDFSKLLRMNFDDALNIVPNASVDLLHIDGLHTYEAVKHDFFSWLPKLSKYAVVLFHDIDPRWNDFGVCEFWEEIHRTYPSFSFNHSYGLGVLFVGKEVPHELRELAQLGSIEDSGWKIRGVFEALGMREVELSSWHANSSINGGLELELNAYKTKLSDVSRSYGRSKELIRRMSELQSSLGLASETNFEHVSTPPRQKRSVLVVSTGNTPSDSSTIVDGNGLRAWGIANGLRDHGFQVSLAQPTDSDGQDSVIGENGEDIFYYSHPNRALELAENFDVIIIPINSPFKANLAALIVDHLSDNHTIVLDAIVPIHHEYLARVGDTSENIQRNYEEMLPVWEKAYSGVDLILCGSERQKSYLIGLLTGTRIISAYNVKKDRLVVVPFGIDSNSKTDEAIQESEINENLIVWYGGLYPWYDIQALKRMVTKLTTEQIAVKFRIRVVGASNPLVNDENFLREAKGFEKDLAENPQVEFISWLPFKERLIAFEGANFVLNFNSPSPETYLSSRIRMMDIINSGTPLLTNGGDFLSEKLIGLGAAFRVDLDNLESLRSTIQGLVENPEVLANARSVMRNLSGQFTWKSSVNELAHALFAKQENMELDSQFDPRTSRKSASERGVLIAGMPSKFELIALGMSQIRSRGFWITLKKGWSVTKRAARNSNPKPRMGRMVFVAHQLDWTGAPLLLADLTEKLSREQALGVTVYSYGKVDEEFVRTALSLQVKLIRLAPWEIPYFHPDDTIIINSIGFGHRTLINLLRESFFTTRKPALLLVHEDRPELTIPNEARIAISNMVINNEVVIQAPSKGTARNLERYFQIDKVRIQSYPIFQGNLNKRNFETLDFHLVGGTQDDRKGQLAAIHAFNHVAQKVIPLSESFRNFSLTLIGVSPTGYGKIVLDSISAELMPFVRIIPPVSRSAVRHEMENSNAVLCLSEFEALPLFVAESMALGHIVFRNQCSGFEEQLTPGVNGFEVFREDPERTALVLLDVLNLAKTTEASLQMMSKASMHFAQPYIGLTSIEYLGLSSE